MTAGEQLGLELPTYHLRELSPRRVPERSLG
jgi:hypothetical protein